MTRAALVNKTRIKICGITSMAMAEVAVEAGADAIGLVFIADSPRAILPGAAYRIAASLPGGRGTAGAEQAAKIVRVCQSYVEKQGLDGFRGCLQFRHDQLMFGVNQAYWHPNDIGS